MSAIFLKLVTTIKTDWQLPCLLTETMETVSVTKINRVSIWYTIFCVEITLPE